LLDKKQQQLVTKGSLELIENAAKGVDSLLQKAALEVLTRHQ
jgi:hypothetical protein